MGNLHLDPHPDLQLGWPTQTRWARQSFPVTLPHADTRLATRLSGGLPHPARGKMAVG